MLNLSTFLFLFYIDFIILYVKNLIVHSSLFFIDELPCSYSYYKSPIHVLHI